MYVGGPIDWIWEILSFGRFLGPQSCREGIFCLFLAIFSRFWPKITLSATLRPHKMAKTQNLPNPINRSSPIHEIEEVCQFLAQSDHFGRPDLNFRWKSRIENFDAKFAKMAVFWPKNGRFLRVFNFFLEFDRNHWNTSLVQNLGHLGHFWPFYGHLKVKFVPFSFIYNYRQYRHCEPYLPLRFVKLRENRRFFTYTYYIPPES